MNPLLFWETRQLLLLLWLLCSPVYVSSDEVAVHAYHHILFEMLGNWSFEDYFKEAAIAWAWELLKEVYHLLKQRIYVTIFGGDQQDGLIKDHEKAAIWAEYEPDAYFRLTRGIGEQGPCGPSSEIHLNFRSDSYRKALPAAQLVNEGHPQVIEIWNAVFMECTRLASGKLVAA